MKLRIAALIVALALGLLAVALPAEAEKAGKVYRIGNLAAASHSAAAANRDAFLQGLRERGWVEGENLIIESRYAEGKLERLPDLAAELVRLRVDVIHAVSTTATRAAMNATTTIPIVFSLVGNPVELGFVASLARPGGNVTGLTSVAGFEIFGKQLELLKDALPNASRVAVLYNPANLYIPVALRETEAAARSLGLQLQNREARGPDEFDSVFAAMTTERADALLVLPDAMFFHHRTRLADLAAKHRLPAMYGHTPHAKAGGLMVYAASMTDLFRRAAGYLDKILRGVNPAELPVERPRKFELIINLKTAKALGLTIPPSVLLRADKVIK
ncbi:MAG: ABC transporter substrate-binding protein [Anaerolineae bacterium]